MSDTFKYNSFLSNYRSLINRLESQHAQEQILKFDGFLGGIQLMKSALAKVNIQLASEYNIFDVLNISTYETKTHTPFLRNLLNPEGTHAQGKLFFDTFFRNVLNNQVRLEKILSFNPEQLSVNEEIGTGNGFIDIFIQHRDKDNPYAVIIENKIYAGDQKLQLERYYNFAKYRYNLSNDQILVLFLSPSGHQPTDYSISLPLRMELENAGVLHTISYKKHIKNWLEKCLPAIQAPLVRTIVQQYIEIIKTL